MTSISIEIVNNVLAWNGKSSGDWTRGGRARGFICAWFADRAAACSVARLLHGAAAVRRDPAGGWFVTIRYHTYAQKWN